MFILFFVLISCNSYSQTDFVLKNDTPFHFCHFNDLIITKELTNNQKHLIYDTVYSSNFNKKGQVIEEYINMDFKVINRYEYDSLNRLYQLITFTKSQFKGVNGLISIDKRIFFYDNCDSLISSQLIKYEKKLKPDIAKKLNEGLTKSSLALTEYQQGYLDYSNDWDSSVLGIMRNFYNAHHNRIMTKFIDQHYGLDSKWDYKYDSLNRKVYEFYCNCAVKPNNFRDSNSCQMENRKYFFYGQNFISTIDTGFGGISMTITKKKYTLTKKGAIDSLIETWESFDKTNNHQKDGEGKIEINYYFDKIERISKRTEYYDGCSDTVRYIYNYKK